jgi:hypothetical protein
MYGMEWNQPAIVAEALAQTSVHGADLNPFLLEAEKRAMSSNNSADGMPSIISLYEEVRANDKLAHAAQMKDSNKVRDGVLVRARDEMMNLVTRVKVRPEDLHSKTVEMFNSVVYMSAAAAFHPPKTPKFDFFLMSAVVLFPPLYSGVVCEKLMLTCYCSHHVNSSPIFLTINAQDWISVETKVRLLEWKIRMDLLQYAARGVPPLSLDTISSYKPKKPSGDKPIGND